MLPFKTFTFLLTHKWGVKKKKKEKKAFRFLLEATKNFTQILMISVFLKTQTTNFKEEKITTNERV